MELNKKKRYLIATSGGPDSVFLVHWLWNKGYRNLVLVHVNYHWREDSNYDQKVVELLAQKFNLALEIKELWTHKLKPLKENFEAWARNQRYEFFKDLKPKYQTSYVIVGHQENDLIETFLLQQKRHGLVNYYGLPEITTHHDLKIWRPLLGYKKSEIINWLNKNKINYATDQTNDDLKFQRNRIRHQIKESEFGKIKKEIFSKNHQNQNENKIIQTYLQKNQKNATLVLTNEIKTWENKLLHRLIYLFFQTQNLEKKLIGRKKQTLSEIVKRILQSNKSFWIINLDSHILMKDYDFLHLLNLVDLPENKTFINSETDFSKLKKFDNKDQIIATIKKNNRRFPYEIWTLNPIIIKGQKWGKKSLQKLLGKRKLSYQKRFKTGIIYSLRQKEFLKGWEW